MNTPCSHELLVVFSVESILLKNSTAKAQRKIRRNKKQGSYTSINILKHNTVITWRKWGLSSNKQNDARLRKGFFRKTWARYMTGFWTVLKIVLPLRHEPWQIFYYISRIATKLQGARNRQNFLLFFYVRVYGIVHAHTYVSSRVCEGVLVCERACM